MTTPFNALTTTHYWAVIGRMPFDDEDLVFPTNTPVTRGEAQEQFKNWIVQDALANADDGDDESTLRSRYGYDNPDIPLQDLVIISAMVSSERPIYTHG